MNQQLLDIINQVRDNKSLPQVSLVENGTRLRDDLGMDSLDLAELTVRIESVYDVDVFADGIVHTVGDIRRKLDGVAPGSE